MILADWLRSWRLRLPLSLWAAPVLAACVACTPRPGPAPVPAPPPAPAPAPAPGEPPRPPEPEAEPPAPLTDPERGPVLFSQWRGSHPEVEAFESFLTYEKVAHVVPSYQLLRTASMWKECKADPF